MPFQEKSAWVMSAALLIGGALYFGVVGAMSAAAGVLVRPLLPMIAVYTVLLVVLAIVGHIAIAVLSPKEANAPLDERERRIFDRAGNVSGFVFGFGAIVALGLYLLSHSGDALFYLVFASLMVSQLTEYAARIFLYRTTF